MKELQSRKCWRLYRITVAIAVAALNASIGSINPACGSDWVEDPSEEQYVPRPVERPADQHLGGFAPHSPVPRPADRPQGNMRAPAEEFDDEVIAPPPIKTKNARTLEGNVSRMKHSPNAGLMEGEITDGWQRSFPPPPRTVAVQPKVFRSWLEKTHPELSAQLTKLGKEAVMEVRGKWDDAGHALRSFGIPYTRIGTDRITGASLKNSRILVVNCAGDVPSQSLSAIERFVYNGGYLLTTDWALDGCLQRAIPDYVEWNGGFTSARVVDATVVDPDPQLFAGAVRHAYWKLDKKSQTLRVRHADRVRVLVRSQQLRQEDASDAGILAVTFNHGRGKVLHLVGHFDNNADRAFNNALSDPAPKIGISLRQALAANFLAEALMNDANTISRSQE